MTVVSGIVDASAHPLGTSLRNHARLVERVLAGAAPVPPRWIAPGWVAQVERVRAHLRPIRSIEALLASYGREAWLMSAHGGIAGTSRRDRVDVPLDLAYALRLLELETGFDQVPWTTLVRRAAESRHGRRTDP